jgi:hypothetical protein
MKAEDRRRYLIQQAQVARGTMLMELQKQGRRLTAGGQALAEKAYQYYGKQRYKEMVVRKAAQKKIVELYNKSYKEIKPSSQAPYKSPLTIKLEKIIFKKIPNVEKKYRAFEQNAFNLADRWEKSRYGKKYKKGWGDIQTTSNALFVGLPTALVNQGINILRYSYKKVKNPKETYKTIYGNVDKKLEYAQKVLKREYEKTNTPREAWNRAVNSYVRFAAPADRLKKWQVKKLKQGLKDSYRYSVKAYRELPRTPKELYSRQIKSIKSIPSYLKVAGGAFAVSSYASLRDMPSGFIELVNNPKNIKQLPSQIRADIKDRATLVLTNPAAGIGKIGADYFTFKVVGESIKFTGKYTSKAARRINPKWQAFKDNRLVIKAAPKEVFVRRGKEVFLKKRVTKTSLVNKVKAKIKSQITSPTLKKLIKVRKAGQFRKFQKTRGLVLRKGLLSETASSFRKQAKLAGTRGTIVTAQADRLVSFFRRNKVIRKPIPGEESLSAQAKRLLEKFDEKSLNKKQFIKLNNLIKKETGKTLLERSIYATPDGTIRYTRLGGEQAIANLRDILRGNVAFRKQKPTVYVFPEEKIAKFPKSLKDVERKLLKNKVLTEAERDRLIEWQTSNKGLTGTQWKPIGDVRYRGGTELEVTNAPGNTIKRVKLLKKTEIDGQGVDIVQAKIIKLKKSTAKLLNKAKKGKLTEKQTRKLAKSLSRETKIKTTYSEIKNLRRNLRRRGVSTRPVFPYRRYSARILSRIKGGRKVSRRTGVVRRFVVKRKSIGRKGTRGRTRITRIRGGIRTYEYPRRVTGRVGGRIGFPTERPPKRPPRIPPRRPPKTPPKKPIFFKGKVRRRMGFKKPPVFNVYGKSGRKVVKLNVKPLTRNDALSRGAFAIDNTTSKTFFIRPAGKIKKPGILKRAERNYFNRAGYKLREYRVKRGRKFVLKQKYIERRKYGIDTRGEKRGLGLARWLKQQRTGKYSGRTRRIARRFATRRFVVRRKVRRISPSQRRILIRRLKKARRVLAYRRKRR